MGGPTHFFNYVEVMDKGFMWGLSFFNYLVIVIFFRGWVVTCGYVFSKSGYFLDADQNIKHNYFSLMFSRRGSKKESLQNYILTVIV